MVTTCQLVTAGWLAGEKAVKSLQDVFSRNRVTTRSDWRTSGLGHPEPEAPRALLLARPITRHVNPRNG